MSRPRIRTNKIKSELVSSTVVGKEYYLRQLRHFDGAKLPSKERNKNAFFINARGYDAHLTVRSGTLC